MLRSLFSGIGGLRAHQQMMDVTGNNIANVNTAGFKASQVVFQDTLSQTLRSATAPQGGQGGANPAQVGLGVQVGAITQNFTQGSAQMTGRPTDLMISGDGFFVTKAINEQLYTRSGSFNFDADGRLVSPDGAAVQGWSGVNGVVDTNAQIGDVRMPMGTLLAPTATTTMKFSGNLPAADPNATVIARSMKTFDQQGNEVTVTATFTKTAANTWDVTFGDGTTTSAAQTVTFAANGGSPTVDADADGTPDANTELSFTATAGNVVVIDLKGLTNYTGSPTVAALSQNGAPAATLQSFNVNPDGQLIGIFSNGQKQTVAQLAMANFNNPPGLEKVGDSMYRFTVNSGVAQIGTAGSIGMGTLQSGMIEMSNVDLAQEFTNLIIAQRGFQANSKVISTSDDILQELVNLKR
jgi:flagellar hook protein FlgE